MSRNLGKLVFLSLALLGMLLNPPSSARAESPLLLEDEALSVMLDGAVQQQDRVVISLRCTNRCETEELIHFLVPRINGKDTVFASQWAGEELALPPGQETAVSLAILKNDAAETPAMISFRMAFQGKLSVPVEIDAENPEAVKTISLAENEPTAVRNEVASDSGPDPEPVLIRDRISPEETARLDYGRAWICLETEEGLYPFCQIRLRVDDQGEAEAEYSGIAFTADKDPGYPLAGEEKEQDGRPVFQTEEIALSSPSVFYATLRLTIARTETGNWAVIKQEYESEELGGAYDPAPLELADEVEFLVRIAEDSPTPRETAGVQPRLLALDRPLSLRARRAADLGRIQIYCEYFFNDGSDTVHPLYPL